nr:hypothetical protein CFP56_17298 [Quercus suber]
MQAFLECWCTATNTLHTSIGEVSISLWDLHLISGLPVYSSFYKEIVPNLKDILSLPSCCHHLFAVKFWFRGKSKYQKPPTRRSLKRNARGKQSHNPSGKIDAPRILTKEDEAPFNVLEVERRAEQPIGNVNPSKIRLKIKQPNEVVKLVKHRSDGKPPFRISEATDESLGEACVDKAHSPKRGPSCIVSTPQDVKVTKAIAGIQELFENDNLGILPMQDDNYSSKRAGEKCTPVATSPSMSEFSIQGPTAFNLATKEIDPSCLGKTNATISSDFIHKPSKDVTRNKSIMCSSSIPATSIVTKFEPDDLISKADRQRSKMLGGDLIEKEQKLTEARHRLTLVVDSEAIKINQKVAIKANLDKALAREIELKKELGSLSMQKAEFTASSTLCDAELAQQQVMISQIKGEVSKIEATQTLEASDDANLESYKGY